MRSSRPARGASLGRVLLSSFRNAQDIGDFALFQLLVFEDFGNMESDLCARQKLVGILEAEIGEDVSGALLELNWFLFFRAHSANSRASAYRFLIKSTSRFGVSMPFVDFF